jgi:hypothetical protein
VGAGGLLLMALLFWAGKGYFYNFFHGPFMMDRDTLLSIQDPGSRRESFVTIQGDATSGTGFEETSTDYFITTHHPILAVKVGERALIVKASKDTEATQLSGELIRTPNDVQNQVISALEQRNPQLRGRFLPVMLDATNYRLNGYLGMTAGAVFGLAMLWCLWKGFSWTTRPETHSVWKKLAKYGPAQQVGSQMDAEFRSAGGGQAFGNARLTTDWLVHASPYNIEVFRMADLVWVYPQLVKHYHSGIPTGKSHFVKVFDREGASTTISVKKNVLPNLMLALQNSVPWAVYGFSADLEKMWKNRRGDFLQTVEQKKKAVQSPATAKPAARLEEPVPV